MKNFTRLLLLSLLLILVGHHAANAQCTNFLPLNGQFPSATVAVGTTCVPVTITTAAYTGEYSRLSGTAAQTYTYTSSVATDFITITDVATNTPIAWGVTPLVYTYTAAPGDIFLYRHDNSSCATAGGQSNRTIQVTCTSCASAGTPLCTTNTAPANNATGVSFTPTITWTAATNASSYDVYLGTSVAGATLLLSNIAATSATLTAGAGLVASTQYFWYVIPKACDGTSPSTCTANATSFTTQGLPPANNDCAGAVTLTPQSFASSCSSPVSATTVNATQSNTNCSATATNDDVWFVFTASATTQTVRFEGVTAVSGTVTSMGMDTYTTCGGTNSNCNTSITLTSGNGQANLTGLTIGTQYFLRVWTAGTSNSATFNICIISPPPPPVNDDCAGATSLTVGTGFPCAPSNPFSWVGATASAVTAPTCGNYSTGDIWYTFTLASDQTVMINTAAGTGGTPITDGAMSLYSGTCGALTEVECDDDDGAGSMPQIRRFLTAGTYYIRFWDYDDKVTTNFGGICVTAITPLANDNCSGVNGTPIVLTPQPFATSCSAPVSATTVGGTQSNTDCTPGGTFAADDVWFQFTTGAGITSQIIRFQNVVTVFGGSVTSMALNTYTSCGGASANCNTSVTLTSGAGQATLTGLTASTTYFLRVWTNGDTDNGATFDICVIDPQPMTYVSSAITQQTGTTSAGSVFNRILRLNVVTINLLNPLTVTQLDFSTAGTPGTSVPADITNARVYYTGATATWTDGGPSGTQFGSTIVNPSGTMTFTGTQDLSGGAANTNNYFWLVYDLACGAVGPNIDASMVTNGLTMTGGPYTPTTPDPASNRTVTALTAFSTAANGNWNNPATWACGVPPSGTTIPIIINHNVTLDVNYDFNANLTINSGRTLDIGANTLTVGPSGGGNRTVSVSGTLNMTGGNLNVNGNIVFNSGSTFNQSAGDLVIDGNSGTSGTSVNSSTSLMSIATSAVNISGGTVLFVDPNINNSSGNSCFSYTGSSAVICSGGLFKLGDGTSTQAGNSATTGFYLSPNSTATARFSFFNLEINGGSTSTRLTRNNWDLIVRNNLTITSGSTLSTNDDVWIRKDLINNGVFINSAYYLVLGDYNSTGPTTSSPTSQVNQISGSGVYWNATSAPTANHFALKIDNTSGTSISVPSEFISGVGTGSVSSALLLSNGILDIGATPLTLGISTGTVGTLTGGSATSYIIGEFQRWIGTTTGNRFFPVGTSSTPRFAQINFTGAQTTGGRISSRFVASTPGVSGLPIPAEAGNGNIVIGAVSPTGYWQIDRLSGAGGTYTAIVDASGFTKTDGSAITDFANVKLVKRTTAGDWAAGADGTASAIANAAGLATATRTGCTAFSVFAIGGTTAALPIELKSFTGKALKAANQLEWTTSTEEGVKEHIIERSANGYNNWTLVGTTPSKGDARVDQSYSMEDKTPLTKSFYRLRSLDLDGREQFSNVISLTRQNNSFGVIAAYPNPAVEMINVQFNTLEEGNITARIVDMTGRLVLEQQMSALNGTNMFPVQLHGLSAGTYFITLSSDNEVAEPIRFVKQ
jgi:hypothetical protein